MALPIGVARDEAPQIGNASGAPKNARLLKKAIYTTLIAASITGTFFFLLTHGYLDFLSPRE